MQDVSNGHLVLASFQVEWLHHQLTHHEKKQKSSHCIKLAVEGEVVTHDDFLDCVARAEVGKLEKDAQKKATKDHCTQGKRNAVGETIPYNV